MDGAALMDFDCRNHTVRAKLSRIIFIHFWFKCLGTISFTSAFFMVYLYLLKNPAVPVTTMPTSVVDDFIRFEPWALPFYLSLWVYVSLPPMLMPTRREIISYGVWIGGLSLAALSIFYFWPSAVPPAHIDWAQYPGMAFLKGIDASGNACPSLHVATAVFSCYWLHWQLRALGLGRKMRLLNIAWCAAITYSTLATKQHVAIDVVTGVLLGIAVAWFSRNHIHITLGQVANE
ncbi:MAG: phosphatase PAP2 family protein [Sulfuricaulis sp.]